MVWERGWREVGIVCGVVLLMLRTVVITVVAVVATMGKRGRPRMVRMMGREVGSEPQRGGWGVGTRG